MIAGTISVTVPAGAAYVKARVIDALGIVGAYSAPVALMVDEKAPLLYGQTPVCIGTKDSGCFLPHTKSAFATQEPKDYYVRKQFSDDGGVDVTKLSSFTLDISSLLPNYVSASSLPAKS